MAFDKNAIKTNTVKVLREFVFAFTVHAVKNVASNKVMYTLI